MSAKDRESIRETLVAYIDDRLAHFKRPKYMRLVDEYPLTATGKVKKNVMRDISNTLIEEGSAEMMPFAAHKNK